MKTSPGIIFRFEPGHEPEAIVDGHPVSPRAHVQREGRDVNVLDFILAWARDDARSDVDRDHALRYVRYYIDELR